MVRIIRRVVSMQAVIGRIIRIHFNLELPQEPLCRLRKPRRTATTQPEIFPSESPNHKDFRGIGIEGGGFSHHGFNLKVLGIIKSVSDQSAAHVCHRLEP